MIHNKVSDPVIRADKVKLLLQLIKLFIISVLLIVYHGPNDTVFFFMILILTGLVNPKVVFNYVQYGMPNNNVVCNWAAVICSRLNNPNFF